MSDFFLGLSSSGHDPSLAIVNDLGNVIFAESTERFLQDKVAWGHSPDTFSHLKHSLDSVGFDVARDNLNIGSSWSLSKKNEIRNPLPDYAQLLDKTQETWLFNEFINVQESLGNSFLRLGLTPEQVKIKGFDHHLCHATSALNTSNYSNAACLVMDGEGEVGSVSIYSVNNRIISRLSRSFGPASLGGLYMWITQLSGYDWRKGEQWKTMGLAATGTPDEDLVADFMKIFRINNGKIYFNKDSDSMQSRINICKASLSYKDQLNVKDFAASGQKAFENYAFKIFRYVRNLGQRNLIFTGGCALNSSLNGKLIESGIFDSVHIPYAPADDGNSIGAALQLFLSFRENQSLPLSLGSPYLGTNLLADSIINSNITPVFLKKSCSQVDFNKLAKILATGGIVGLYRGSAEFGPRALGNRSILADPRFIANKDKINRIKGREQFRPVAPVIIKEEMKNWFVTDVASPYMSSALLWRSEKIKKIPAAHHDDGTGRVQTVSYRQNKWLYCLIKAFYQITGVPILLNTSLNIMGKPIVHSLEDALGLFFCSPLDALVIGDILIEK